MNRSSYVCPHRHEDRGELAIVVRGAFDLLLFEEDGRVSRRDKIDGGAALAYQLPPRAWHTLVARTDGSVFLEIKQGPYDPSSAAEFAPWAPQEGHAAAAAFHRWLQIAQPGEMPLAEYPRVAGEKP